MERRDLLTAIATGATATIAGCSSFSNSVNGNSLPSYHTNIPDAINDSENSFFAHLNVGQVIELGGLNNEETETATPTDTEDDPATPLITAPVVGSLLTVVFGLGFGLSPYGDAGGRINENVNFEELEAADESDVSTVTFVTDAIVITGSFSTEEYIRDLPSSFSEESTRDGYTIYISGQDDTAAIAISEDTVVVSTVSEDSGQTGQEAVTTVLDVQAGEEDRLAQSDDDIKWALQTAGNHTFVFGTFGDTEIEAGNNEEDDSQYNPLAGSPVSDAPATALVSGASIDSDSGGDINSASADTALVHTGDPLDQSTLNEFYSDSDADVTASVSSGEAEDSQRVSLSASFSEAPLDPGN
jgi:hypothetical protein